MWMTWMALLPALGVGLVGWGGCSRDVRLADRKIRSVKVGTVTHYGTTLDRDASPEKVTYVLLRAIRDDFLAQTDDARETALDKQFDLCAADVIARRNRLRISRDEFIHNVVYRWTPTVSHYVHDFETEWEKARERLVPSAPRTVKGSDNDSRECEVFMEVDDPGGDPSARVVMVVYLTQDDGYWRVLHLGFDPRSRTIGN